MPDTQNSSVLLPQDPIFFTETVLGLISIAGSIIMGASYHLGANGELVERMKVLDLVTDRTYEGKFTNEHAKLLVDFIKNPIDYQPLLKLQAILAS